MKIFVLFPYDNGEQDRFPYFQYYITLEDEYDVEVISKIIKAGDLIQLDKSYWTSVMNINYNAQQKIIEIEGEQLRTIKTFTIGANMKVGIEIDQEDNARLDKMNRMIKDIPKYEMYKKSVSTEHIQNEGFRILHEYMNRKPHKLVFGNDVISSMNNELVKVVFVCWKFFKTHDIKMVKILTQENHKHNNANIIVVWKGNENYEELKNYGGIVGVLY